MSTRSNRIHPFVKKAQEQLYDGRISRREFLRLASLMGVSAPVAYVLAACGAPATPTAAPPTAVPATQAPVSAIKRGGTIRIGAGLQAIDHPARLSWTEGSDVTRNVFEYLTQTDRNNVTHPYLLESWEASDDATEWKLNLRQGVKWHNGDPFVAEHVVFNFGEWLNPDTGSSILGFFEGFLKMDGVKATDDHTVTLQFSRPKVDVAENLFHYPAQIVHSSFNGDITTGTNPGTGAFNLEYYRVGEGGRVTARDDYWQMGEDGKPLPYLDAIEFIDLGTQGTAYIAALEGGQIDTYGLGPDDFLALKDHPKLTVYAARTAQTRVLRFRVDLEPWTDNRIRLAVKKCQDREKIVQQAQFGEADAGHDTHVAPVQPDFAPIDLPAYDPEGAKALLAEAGMENLSFKIAVGSEWTDIVTYIETLKEDAKPAGINIELETMPVSAYWDLWTEAAVGVTPWTHRPLAVMLLPLAYIADSEGNPVPWNESRWVDEEFTSLLQKAQGIADSEARREVMKELEIIQRDRGSIGIAYWQHYWDAYNPAFQNVGTHPTGYRLLYDAWYDPDKDPFKS